MPYALCKYLDPYLWDVTCLCFCIEMLDAKDAEIKRKGEKEELKYKRRICVEFTSSWKKRS